MQHVRFTFTLALFIAACQVASSPWAADTTQAARLYEDALTRYEKHDDAGAIVQLKNALQRDPSYLSAYLLLGQAQLRKGDAPGAELSFATALKNGAGRSEVMEPLAEAYMAQGKYKELLNKVNPNGLPPEAAAGVWLIRASAALALGDFPGAEQAIDKAATSLPNAGRVDVARGMLYLQRGKLAEANKFADRAVAAMPKDPSTWNLKASVAHARGDSASALDGYGRALALEPRFIDVRVARAGLLLDMNRLEDAFKDLSFLKEQFPEEPRAAYLRSVYFDRKGNGQASNAELLHAAKVLGGLPPAIVFSKPQLLMLGALTNYSIKAYEQAQTYAEGYIRLNPGHPGARKLLGAILLSRGEIASGIAHLENAQRAAPGDPQVLQMLASAYIANNQHVKAANLLEQAGSLVRQSPQLASTLGYSLIGVGREAQGLEYLTQAFGKNPANYRLAGSLVMFNIQSGKPGDAVRVAEAFKAKHPKDASAYNLLGVAKAGANDFNGARAAYQKALELAPQAHSARFNLGKLESSQGRHDAARQQFQVVLKSQPKNSQAQYEMGNVELAAGRMAEAVRWLQGAHATDARNVVVAVKLIDTYLRLGQQDKALELAKQTSARAPDNFEVTSALGRAHAAAGEMQRAHLAFAHMSKLAGFDVPRLEQAARLQLMAGDLTGAGHSLNKALGERPGAVEANLLMAELERRKGNPASGLDRVRRMAESHPRSAPVQRGLGDALMAARHYDAAAKAYREALSLADSEEHALRYKGALLSGGNAAQATQFLEDWSRRHPKSAAVLIALGETHMQSGQLDKARGVYETYLKQHGDHPIVLNNLANILAKQGGGNALAMAERAYKLAPDAAPVNDTLGWLLLNKGDVEQALRFLREARTRAPNLPEMRYHLAVALQKSGRRGEAKKELEAALAGGSRFDGYDDAVRLLRSLQGG